MIIFETPRLNNGSRHCLKNILTKTIAKVVHLFGAEYVEVRAEQLSKTMITLKEGRVECDSEARRHQGSNAVWKCFSVIE